MAVAGAAALSGCDTAAVMTEDLFSGGLFSGGADKVCPNIAIPPHTDTMTTFKIGIGRDLIDVTFDADFVGGALECRYGKDGALSAIVVVEVAAKRGPAAPRSKPLEIALPIFVAKMDRTGEIRDKAVFKTLLRFPENVQLSRRREAFDVDFNLGPGEIASDVGVLVGFQLTEEQLKFNQTKNR